MLSKVKLPVLVAALVFAFSNSWAQTSKTYQVTGPVLELSDKMIVIQKGNDRWEIARDANTKSSNANLKVGDKATVEYRMTATSIEAKGSGAKGKKQK